MKKQLTSIIITAAMGISSFTPVMAADTITVPGEVLYAQDFENTVDTELTTPVSANGGFKAAVEDYLGNNVLKISGCGAYGYYKFGPQYSDAVIKADVMQLGASGNYGAYLGVGMRAVRQQGGAYYSNMGTYYDVLWYNDTSQTFDKQGIQLRDRIGIVKEWGPDYSERFEPHDAMSDPVGILDADQIFTDSNARAHERNFNGKYYRMQSSIIGGRFTNSMKTESGELLQSVIADNISSYGESGYTKLQAHSGDYMIDNIKIMSPIEISDFSVAPESETIELGSSAEFAIKSGNAVIQPDVARYEYDETAINIDFANGTVAPLKTGTYTVNVYLDDIYGSGSISDSFTVTGTVMIEKPEVVIENPNPTYGEGTAVTVYYGGKDVTDSAQYSGDVVYSDKMLSPTAYGLVQVNVTYDGKTVTVPLAVNNSSEMIGEKAKAPVFTEDFEGDVSELTAAYANGNANITVTNASNSNEGNTSKALLFNNIQASTSTFGPKDISDYTLEFDFYCPTPKGSSGSFLGATMRANSTNGGYKVGYTPVMKYNASTHMIDTTLSATNSRQITAAFGMGNDLSKWYYSGFNGSSLQGSAMQGYWFTYSAEIKGDDLKTVLKRRSSGSLMASYNTTLSSMADGGARERGATTLSTSQNVVYFDNIKIYPIYAYADIAVDYTETTDTATAFTVTGTDGNGGDGALLGTVSVSTMGDVTATPERIKPGEGLGYVTVKYTDNFGMEKYKVIKTGSVGALKDTDEFTLTSDVKLYDQNGNELSAIISNAPVYAQADIKRTALDGHGVLMAVAVYNWDTGEMVSVSLTTADAVQRVGDEFRMYTKFILPENEDGYLYAKVILMTSGLKPLTEHPFEV